MRREGRGAAFEKNLNSIWRADVAATLACASFGAGAWSRRASGDRDYGRAEASVVIDISQVGSDVVATGSGTVDLTDLAFVGSSIIPVEIFPIPAIVVVGSGGPHDTYTGLIGPTSFGSGGSVDVFPGPGDTFGVAGLFSELAVPSGYVSGSPLSGSWTLGPATLTSLGLTPGTYVYTWGGGADADSLTVKIGATIPEPSTWAMMLLGFAGLGFAWWHAARRRRCLERAA